MTKRKWWAIVLRCMLLPFYCGLLLATIVTDLIGTWCERIAASLAKFCSWLHKTLPIIVCLLKSLLVE
jgi:hypothetical protein